MKRFLEFVFWGCFLTLMLSVLMLAPYLMTH